MKKLTKKMKEYPKLTREEEVNLFKEYHNGSQEARAKLIESGMSNVVIKANMHIGYVNNKSITIDDLIQAGMEGLILAVDKFDLNKKVRLKTYANYWIDCKIKYFVMNNFAMARFGTTPEGAKLFFKIGDILDKLSSGDYSREEVAEKYGVRLSDVEVFDVRVVNYDLSLDARLPSSQRKSGDKDSKSNNTLHHTISNESNLVEEVEQKDIAKLVIDAVENDCVLNKREIDIIRSRFLLEEPITLQDVGDKYGISRERVRQLQSKAFNKLEKYFKSHYSASDFGLV